METNESLIIFRHNQLFKVTKSATAYTVEEWKYGEFIWKSATAKETINEFLKDCDEWYVTPKVLGSQFPL